VTEAPDPYKILQVDSEAEDEVIQAAYRRLAQKYHPDLSAGQAAMDRMVAINAAWETIGDPQRRAIYDGAHRANTTAAPDVPGQPGRPAAEADGQRTEARGAAPGSGGPDARRREHPSTPGSRPSGPHSGGAHEPGTRSESAPETPRPPETVSRDWTPGRSTIGSGYDAKTMRAPEGHGAAGPPPGNPSGGVVTFGRYAGWSIGEIGRKDLEYLEWLDRMPIGRPYRPEIDVILRQSGRRRSASADATQRRGLFRRS
jgi:curved DNA-binding protein CbpA